MWLVSPSLSTSRRGSRCYSSQVTGFWSFWACHVSWEPRICLVSCSNSFSKCWLLTRSASTSSVLACTVSNAPPGGRLSTPSGWSCILGGLALLLFVFRVDTISRREVSFICRETVVPTDDAKLMMFFQPELGLEHAGFAGPVRWLWALDSSTKTRNKKDRCGLARCRSDA